MILKIHYWPDPCLKLTADEVTDFDLPLTDQLIEDLFETMYAGRGIGLAATQCNIQQRVLVIDTTVVGGGLKQAFINPVILEKSDDTVESEEGCLSFPGVFANVSRHKQITVRNTTIDNEQNELVLTGVDAVCLQHELDHLNGIIFFDYLKDAKRRMVEEKVRKNVKRIQRRKQ